MQEMKNKALMNDDIQIKINHVGMTFKDNQGNDVQALKDVNLDIKKGEFISLLGPSGCGKTTLLRIIADLQEPTTGTVRINGMTPREVRLQQKFGIVFQSPVLLDWRTVRKNIELPLEIMDYDPKKLPARSQEMLDLVGLSKFADHYPKQLSGGMQQRVGIARALTTTPDILLCDEATSALDPQTTESILKLLKKINKEMGVTILLITHQMQVVQMICNKVAVMENGKVVESGSVLDVFGKPQASVTKRFVQTVINDQIPESIVSLVKEQKEHFQVERLKFIGSSVKRPVISDICQVEGIVVNILGATVQELQESVMCVFILQLIGSEDKICKAEKQIDANGVIRERVEVI